MIPSNIMRRGMIGLLPLLAACAGATPSATQPANTGGTTAAITEADLRTRLYIVADDSMGGRPTGSVGHIKTTQYVADELKRLGLQPAGDNGTYFQTVPMSKKTISANSSVDVDGRTLQRGVDYAPAVIPGAVHGPFDGAQVIYGGVVNDTTTQITSEQAAGKIVLLRIRGTGLMLARGINNNRWSKAAGLVFIGAENTKNFWPQLAGGGPALKAAPVPNAPTPVNEPTVMLVVASGASTLMGAPWDSTVRPGTLGRVVRGRIAFVEEDVVARNVVAVIPGSDPALRGQYVAIGAHIDHDPPRAAGVDHDSLRAFNAMMFRKQMEKGGANLTAAERSAIRVNVDSLRRIRPARRDSILNGADDDGSGTVATLELAEAMIAAPKPKRSTIFVWHVAEELGLFGAAHFTDHPTVPRDSIVAQLNMDMIGRGEAGTENGGGPTYLQLIGWRRLSNELGDIILAANRSMRQPFTFDLQYDANGHPQNYYCRSDHYMYARYGIPISFFTTGSHGDYHQVTDEPQYIDYAKLRNVASLVHEVALRVSNLDHRVVVDGQKPASPNAPCRQ